MGTDMRPTIAIASKPRRVRGALAFVFLGVCGAAAAQVGVNKSFNPISTSVGQVSVATITLLNPIATPATGTDLTDNLPTNLIIANPPGASTTCGGTLTATNGTGLVALVGGTIPAATSGPGICTITVNVLANVAGTFVNDILAGGVTSSQGSNTQDAQATLTVIPLAAVAASKV